MNAYLTILSNPEKLAKTGSIRTIFDLTRRVDGYHLDANFIAFRDVEMFHLMEGDHRAKWVCLAGDGIVTRLDAVNGRLHVLENHDERGTVIMSWERENADVAERVVIPVEMDEPWHEYPTMQFINSKQYGMFMSTHNEHAGGVLNRLYTAYENDGKTTISSDLAVIIAGQHKGEVMLVKKNSAAILELDEGEVFEQETEWSLHELPEAIHFKIFYGQRREQLRTLKGHRLVKGPDPVQDVLVNGKEWLPQVNQLVNVSGLEDVYFIVGYDKEAGKPLVQLADPIKAKKVMDATNASTSRYFKVDASRLTPVIFKPQ